MSFRSPPPPQTRVPRMWWEGHAVIPAPIRHELHDGCAARTPPPSPQPCPCELCRVYLATCCPHTRRHVCNTHASLLVGQSLIPPRTRCSTPTPTPCTSPLTGAASSSTVRDCPSYMASWGSLPDISVVRTAPTPQITAIGFWASNTNAKPLVSSIFGKLLTPRQGVSRCLPDWCFLERLGAII
ncbi:hypothetical protein BT67DRAFT_18804 [Trichocladium antarcticum]|uniref:Uncharacterized protein n=1 Tax=Trichocladium antarcticum TaxID=1450529 RepID=A0AAN6UVN3_9PEZI|nr:hypothetical protein BT67DRAFT_18804 [Trichocladium antarcticum]